MPWASRRGVRRCFAACSLSDRVPDSSANFADIRAADPLDPDDVLHVSRRPRLLQRMRKRRSRGNPDVKAGVDIPGCSTGGREGMILSQRYPTIFNGIISGDPAMRTGLSNLAIGRWIPLAFNQIAPKDANGKPIIEQSIADNDRTLVRDALIKKCDAKDGAADGLISDPLACDFDPEMLACKGETNNSCLAPEKAAAIKKALGGPKSSSGTQVYAEFLYDTGITNGPPFRGLLSPGPGIFGPATTDMTIDVDKEALSPVNHSWIQCPRVTTFSAHGGEVDFLRWR